MTTTEYTEELMKTQIKFKTLDYLKYILDLHNLYPTLPIKFFAAYDSFSAEDDYYIEHTIYKVEIQLYYVHSDEIMNDEDEIIEQLIEDAFSEDEQSIIDSHEFDNYYEDIAQKRFNELKTSNEIKTIIAVYTH